MQINMTDYKLRLTFNSFVCIFLLINMSFVTLGLYYIQKSLNINIDDTCIIRHIQTDIINCQSGLNDCQTPKLSDRHYEIGQLISAKLNCYNSHEFQAGLIALLVNLIFAILSLIVKLCWSQSMDSHYIFDQIYNPQKLKPMLSSDFINPPICEKTDEISIIRYIFDQI